MRVDTAAYALFFALPASLDSVAVDPVPAIESEPPIVSHCSACGDDLVQRKAIERHNADCAATGERVYRVAGRLVRPTPRTTWGRIA